MQYSVIASTPLPPFVRGSERLLTNIDVPAYAAPGTLGGHEASIVSTVTSTLNANFSGLGVTFTSDAPGITQAHSTVYVGGTDAPFTPYGSFLGLAEAVDVGNQNPNDNAFVFSDRLAPLATSTTAYVQQLTGTIAHETGHVLGYEHLDAADDTFTLVGTLNDNATFVFIDRLGAPIDGTQTVATRPAKPRGITATVAAGGRLAVGTYKYRVTILDATGAESNAFDELAGAVTSGNQTVKLSGIAVRTVPGTVVRIYRTQANGTTFNWIATLTGLAWTPAAFPARDWPVPIAICRCPVRCWRLNRSSSPFWVRRRAASRTTWRL